MPKRKGLTPLRLVKSDRRDPPDESAPETPQKGPHAFATKTQTVAPRPKKQPNPNSPTGTSVWPSKPSTPAMSVGNPPEEIAGTIDSAKLAAYLKSMPAQPASPLDEAAKRRARNSGRAVDIHVKRGSLCVVKSGENVGPGLSAGHVVRFIRAPVPATATAVFQYAPGVYAFSKSDGLWVGKDNAHYCCLIDRTRLRLLELHDLECDSESLSLLKEIIQQHEQDDTALAAKQAQLFLLLTSSRQHADPTLSAPIGTQPARQVQLATPAEQRMANQMDAATDFLLKAKAKQTTEGPGTEQ